MNWFPNLYTFSRLSTFVKRCGAVSRRWRSDHIAICSGREQSAYIRFQDCIIIFIRFQVCDSSSRR